MNHLITIAGAGPGDPDLLTVKAYKRLAEADVVLYDALPGEELLAIAPLGAEFIYAGKISCDGQSQFFRQQAINQTILLKAKQGKKVVRLKGGDPMIFGRGAEEIRFCKEHRLNYEVIPGITAAIAASAEFEIPLTEREKSTMVLLYSGSCIDGKFKNIASVVEVLKAGSTVSVYMGIKNLTAFIESIVQEGILASTPINILSKVSQKGSESIYGNLSNIISLIDISKPATPAMVIIGQYAQPIQGCAVDTNNEIKLNSTNNAVQQLHV